MRITKSILFLIMAGCVLPASAQTPPAAASPSAAKVQALVPQEAVACLTVRLQQVRADQALRLIPWEVFSAASVDALGIDLSDLERFDLIVGPIAEPPGIAGILTGKSKLDLSRLNPELFEPEEGSKTYRMLGNRDMRNMHIFPLSDTQVAVGHTETLPTLLNAQRGPGDLHKQMQRLGESGHISLIFVPEPIRPLLAQGLGSMPPELAEDAKVLVEKIQLIAARAQVDTNPTINVLIEAANEADAQAVEASWNRLVTVMVPMMMRQYRQQVSDQSLVQPMQGYMARVSKEIKTILQPTRKGSRLLLSIDQRATNLIRGMTTYVNLGEMLRSTGSNGGFGRGFEQRPPRSPFGGMGNTDTERLKKIGLAIHNYESAFKALPMAGDTNQQKQKQLSWRVNLLPFFGEAELTQLYEQFKQDEPWDSENNAKLLAKMPDVYRYSKANALPPGHTVIQMPQGPNMISEAGRRVKFADVTDGLSNTILIALSTNEAAVPWTRPDDFNPLENLDLIRVDGGQMVFGIADGSVSQKPAGSTEQIKRMLTRNGGETE